MTGYDLDGTICVRAIIDKKWTLCNGYERKIYQAIREYHYRGAELVLSPPEKDYVIITSRRPKLAEITLQWLNGVGLEPFEVYFMDMQRTRNNMALYKIDKINELKLEKYYEDDPKIVKILTKKCPNTEIVLVESVAKEYSIKNVTDLTLQI